MNCFAKLFKSKEIFLCYPETVYKILREDHRQYHILDLEVVWSIREDDIGARFYRHVMTDGAYKLRRVIGYYEAVSRARDLS